MQTEWIWLFKDEPAFRAKKDQVRLGYMASVSLPARVHNGLTGFSFFHK